MADSTDPPPELVVTTELLLRAKDGDRAALDELMSRYLPRVTRWAAGRLPAHARSMLDTGDLVQDVLMRSMQGLDRFEVRRPGGFQAYVRQAILNRIRDQVRRSRLRPRPDEDAELDVVDPAPSPLDVAIGLDVVERYEAAMTELEEEERQILHLHVELDYDYGEIAATLDKPSRDAARMAVQRALRRLAKAMSREGPDE